MNTDDQFRRGGSMIATQLFRFATRARPEQVWVALTRPALTATYLYGLAAHSDWRAGSPIAFTSGAGSTVTGEVLAVEEPRRLSYSLAAGDGQPATYVTWEVVEEDGITVVRLYVDEPGASTRPGADAETEATWLRAVARLESVLASVGADQAPGGAATS
ncbi:MAG TPA: SRPBCC domain-containing protein [Acidimicrobiales bacterium]|nr:SRPBCC domain-containing protein [Acidimicrobiales bacterium]